MTRYKLRVTERSVDAPGQNFGCKRRLRLNFNDLSNLPPDPLCKVGKIDVRADALTLRQRPLQMAGDRGAGDDDFLCNERTGNFLREMLNQCLAELLKAI